MAYRLGVDLGTTYTAAALNVDGRLEMLSLGNRSTQIPSVLYLKQDGTVLIGEPAEFRGAADPTRLAREFKRRIGGVVPMIVGGSPFSPQALSAKVLSWTVEVATRQQGAPPEYVCVTHPANWGPFKQEILGQVLKLAGQRGAGTCPEPEAAAIAYAHRDRVPEGATLAVYDLGGGTFDAAVLVRQGTGSACWEPRTGWNIWAASTSTLRCASTCWAGSGRRPSSGTTPTRPPCSASTGCARTARRPRRRCPATPTR